MLTREEVEKYLSNLLNMKKYKDEPNENGLVIKGKNEINKIGVAVNNSLDVINRAIKNNIDFLIVHHSMFGVEQQTGFDRKKILKKHNILLCIVHDCLDCAPGIGTSDILAKKMNIKVEGRFVDWNFLPWKGKRKHPASNSYAGVYGTTKENFSNFVEKIGETLKTNVIFYRNNKKFGKIGIVAGGGLESLWIKEAKKLGCDTFLTGEGLSFGSIYAKEIDMNLILGTHHATERLALINLSELIQKNLSTSVIFLEEEILG